MFISVVLTGFIARLSVTSSNSDWLNYVLNSPWRHLYYVLMSFLLSLDKNMNLSSLQFLTHGITWTFFIKIPFPFLQPCSNSATFCNNRHLNQQNLLSTKWNSNLSVTRVIKVNNFSTLQMLLWNDQRKYSLKLVTTTYLVGLHSSQPPSAPGPPGLMISYRQNTWTVECWPFPCWLLICPQDQQQAIASSYG